MEIRCILHFILCIPICIIVFNNSAQKQQAEIKQLITQNNITKIQPYPKQAAHITKLSYINNVSVEILQPQVFDDRKQILHINPQILVNEYLFKSTLKGERFRLHELESLLITFQSPQVVNLVLIHVQVKTLDKHNHHKSEMDEYQTKKFRFYGIYRNREYLLINKILFKENDKEVFFRSSESNQYLKIYLPCKITFCENPYRSFRIQFVSPNEYTHLYPIALYQISNLDLLNLIHL